MPDFELAINECLYNKDPQSTELGKQIIRHGTLLIKDLGFEAFTFKKLSLQIPTTEASIYRYFDNKHRLLVYLISWYWVWLEHRICMDTNLISDPIQKLDRIIQIITETTISDNAFPDIDETALRKIVICESDKTYLTKKVDQDNEDGLFKGYNYLCQEIASLINEINPEFAFPYALISTALEAAHQQLFFATHLPTLTEISQYSDPNSANYLFLKNMIFKTINLKYE